MAGTFLFIFKNVIGWLLILASPVLGITVPGPGGIPVFLIGFALVTFPGKRRLTSRVMRGRGVRVGPGPFTFICALFSVLLTIGLVLLGLHYWNKATFDEYREQFDQYLPVALAGIVAFGAISFPVTWVVFRAAEAIANWFIRKIPWIRRKMRPWLKAKGIDLLPARRKRAAHAAGQSMVVENQEIIEFDKGLATLPARTWKWLQPWLRRMLTVGITLYIVAKMFAPLQASWNVTRVQLQQMSMLRFVLASAMFAFFLLAFRALVWRHILKSFGHALPCGAAVRIWSTSELARYLPGAIWQVIGRVMLVKPYGVTGSICSTTQILELCIFLMANVLVASAAWLYYGAKVAEESRAWFYTAIALVPLLAVILHPRIFYSVVNFVLARIKKPAIVQRLRGKRLLVVLVWTIVGLLWQSLAVYFIAQRPLGLKIDWLWMIAGAYSLAWCAGFLAFWAPGGIGVREIVFVAAMGVMLPESVRDQPPFNDDVVRTGVLVGLGLLLRLWSVLGELLLASIAYTWDYRGAIGLARPYSATASTAPRIGPATPPATPME